MFVIYYSIGRASLFLTIFTACLAWIWWRAAGQPWRSRGADQVGLKARVLVVVLLPELLYLIFVLGRLLIGGVMISVLMGGGSFSDLMGVVWWQFNYQTPTIYFLGLLMLLVALYKKMRG